MDTLESGIVSALPQAERKAEYDRIARAYDAIVGNGFYNRVVWGCRKSDYERAARDLLARTPAPQQLIDFGCGSLVFTADAYRDHVERLTLFDRSLGMLERGKARLPQGSFVQGDALHPPFAARSFAGGMSWGMIHIFGSASDYLGRLADLLAPKAPVATSSLVLSDRRIGNRMLAALHRRGEAAAPEDRATVERHFSRHFALEKSSLVGNMLFLSGRRHPG